MKTLTREPRLLPHRAQFLERGPVKSFIEQIRALPDRALFWVGVLLFTTGTLKIEDLPE